MKSGEQFAKNITQAILPSFTRMASDVAAKAFVMVPAMRSPCRGFGLEITISEPCLMDDRPLIQNADNRASIAGH